MKKGVFILLLGIVMATAAFTGFYYSGTAPCRSLMREPEPELAWLKREFHLSDAEYARVTELHAQYLPRCAERCRRIEDQTAQLRRLLHATPTITTEVRTLIAQRATLRAECEAEMLEHFLAVSRSMPPAEGQRYLEWVERQSHLQGEGMEKQHHTADHPDAPASPHP